MRHDVVTLIATGDSGMRAAACLAGAGIPSRVLCVGWDPEERSPLGPSTGFFSALPSAYSDLEWVLGACISPLGIPWTMGDRPDPGLTWAGSWQRFLNQGEEGAQPEVRIPILGRLEQLRRQIAAVFDVGGDVIPDVVVQEFETTQGRVESVLTEHGREYVNGRLWCDATPRRIMRWMSGCGAEVPGLAAGLRCGDRVRITGHALNDAPCWVMSHHSSAGTDWRHRMWPGLWPGMADWVNWITIEGVLAPRHPWALLPEDVLARAVVQEWGAGDIADDAELIIEIQRNAVPQLSAQRVSARRKYLELLEEWGICPIGGAATYQKMDMGAELVWARMQMDA